ncbi:dynein intermediate chain 1, axonemal [Cyclospora cayetanensis]|uniref:Dynein intermediate chain 1, axonemal n=1 Tax=Cyclospora cayetanensis TaxID=88456 RepID=A0A6P6RSH6_9EIME|nr:dynein intermediate chain 1, axonemal [Cyclospora cayetanensis]
MNKQKQTPSDRAMALPKRVGGHRRSSLAIFFRGEELQESDDNQANQRLKPKDQLQLSPEELRQRMPPNTLYPKNPRAPQNITRFSFKENQFKKEGDVDQTVFHLSIESTLLLKDSAEATEQEELLRLRKEAAELRKELEAVEVSIEDDGSTQDEEGRVMRNQFNNVDRATHIRSRATVERSCFTVPPPKRTCCGTVNRWIICDAYAKEAEMQNRKESELKVLERVVSFIAQLEAYREFQATDEDACDTSLSVTPIWELRLPRIKGKDAMALQWNPYYHDLLAVGFVRWDVDTSTSQLSFISVSADGCVMRWTLLKNKLESEVLLTLKRDTGALGGDAAGVSESSTTLSLATGLCFDFCSASPQVFIVGTEEGSILKCSKDYSGQLLSSYKGHNMPVHGVHWNPFSEHIFISASADWHVMIWDDRLQKNIFTLDYGTVSLLAVSSYARGIWVAFLTFRQ